MPPKRSRARPRQESKSKARLSGKRVMAPDYSARPPMPTLQEILAAVPKKPTLLQLCEYSDDEKESKAVIPLAPSLKGLMRGMFKADHPFRTRLGLTSLLSTGGTGTLATLVQNTLLASTTEWGSIDALFDEFYIHAIHLTFVPYNHGGGGVGSGASITYGNPVYTATNSDTVVSTGLQLVSLFGPTASYSSATNMLANPSLAVRMSNSMFKYAWKNNVRFDPHGISFGQNVASGWQGWCYIGDSAAYGGAIQFRTVADRVLGDGGTVFNLGNYNLVWDVSFRARS